MGSDMYKQSLKNVVQHLVAFERAPKDIKGRQITEWFRTGEQLFEEFHGLGINVAWTSAAIKDKPEVPEIITRITNNQNWLQTFVTAYPNLRLDLDGGFPAADICRVRSGLEFLLRGFVNINSSFDKVLKNLQMLGELDEFDGQLKVWVETGHRPDFFSGDKHPNIPASHWWWF